MDQLDMHAKQLSVLRGTLARWLLPFDTNTAASEQRSVTESVLENEPGKQALPQNPERLRVFALELKLIPCSRWVAREADAGRDPLPGLRRQQRPQADPCQGEVVLTECDPSRRRATVLRGVGGVVTLTSYLALTSTPPLRQIADDADLDQARRALQTAQSFFKHLLHEATLAESQPYELLVRTLSADPSATLPTMDSGVNAVPGDGRQETPAAGGVTGRRSRGAVGEWAA